MFPIVLDPAQKEELGKDIYTTVTDAIKKARQEEQQPSHTLIKKKWQSG